MPRAFRMTNYTLMPELFVDIGVSLCRHEHHNATNTTWDFRGNCDRIPSLRLHPHAERPPNKHVSIASPRWPLASSLFALATQTTAPHFSSWHPIGLKACRSVTQAIVLEADEITCACPEKTQRGAKADRVTVDVQLKMGSRPAEPNGTPKRMT